MSLSSVPLSQNVRARTWRRFLRHKLAVTSLIILLILCVMAAAGPLIESWLRVDAMRTPWNLRNANG